MNADHVSISNPRKKARPDSEVDPEALRRRWHVMFSVHFGIRPWEWDQLEWSEVLDYVAACEQIVAASST